MTTRPRRQRSRWSLISHCTGCALLLLGIAGRTMAAEALPDDVARTLASNAKAISPITVAWDKTRSSDLTAVEVTRKLNFQIPERSIGFLEPESVRQQWNGLKFYAYTMRKVVQLNENDLSPKEMVDDVLEQTFDTKKIYLGNDERFSIDHLHRPHMSILHFKATNPLPDYFKENEEFYWVSYFQQAGFRLTTHFVLFGTEPRSAVAYLVDQGWKVIGAEEAKLESAACLKVTIKKNRVYTVYLDRALNLAVRRREEFTPSGKLDVRADMSDFRQLPDSPLWLPQRCEVDYFGWSPTKKQEPGDKPLFHETFRVTEMHKKPIDEKTFTLNYMTPGTFISDGTLPGAFTDGVEFIEYQIPKDPADLPKVIEEAIKQAREDAKSAKKAK